VWDGAAAFAAAAGVDAVRAALDGAWAAIQPRATRPMLLLLLAPPPGDAHAEAARAGLENLARTLSIEWARMGIRPVAIHPGAATAAGEVAELAAFLASPAGAYYSGCRFDVR
jgi:NAD(P)-dependent dehydrogenase (short-subunit alcohol dehydrogenase family)